MMLSILFEAILKLFQAILKLFQSNVVVFLDMFETIFAILRQC